MKAEFPRLNVLVNSAGVMLGRNLSDPTHDLVDLTREIDKNLSGVVRTTAALMDLIIANRGTILNISSALALVPAPAMPIAA
ncbi:short-subunit dehydrogenase involved in D-alanine esterification of teichoic acids [Brevundimonas sp. 1080]